MNRLIMIDPVTGCVEACSKIHPNTTPESVRRKAGVLMDKKGLEVSKIKSGANVAG